MGKSWPQCPQPSATLQAVVWGEGLPPPPLERRATEASPWAPRPVRPLSLLTSVPLLGKRVQATSWDPERREAHGGGGSASRARPWSCTPDRAAGQPCRERRGTQAAAWEAFNEFRFSTEVADGLSLLSVSAPNRPSWAAASLPAPGSGAASGQRSTPRICGRASSPRPLQVTPTIPKPGPDGLKHTWRCQN